MYPAGWGLLSQVDVSRCTVCLTAAVIQTLLHRLWRADLSRSNGILVLVHLPLRVVTSRRCTSHSIRCAEKVSVVTDQQSLADESRLVNTFSCYIKNGSLMWTPSAPFLSPNAPIFLLFSPFPISFYSFLSFSILQLFLPFCALLSLII